MNPIDATDPKLIAQYFDDSSVTWGNRSDREDRRSPLSNDMINDITSN